MSETTTDDPPTAVKCRGLIYVVDDEPMLLELAMVILEAEGYAVKVFRDPEVALQTFAAMRPRPDVLITDYRLPDGRTAEDVVRLTTAAFETPLPLIVVTGEMRVPGDAWLGSGKILRKPVSPTTLAAEIAAACVAARSAAG